MQIFDLHADTPSLLFYEKKSFADPSLHFSAGDLENWEHSTQVLALFCRPGLTDDEAYRDFFAMRADTLAKIAPHREKLTPILAVEDARLLGNSRERLTRLAACGVRILTLLWRGETTIGGAFDTAVGLTSFGKSVLADCFALGVLPDLSHASLPAFWDAAEMAEEQMKPLLATHSNARTVRDHPRNLYDEQFLAIRRTGGLVGLCLCPEHLTARSDATLTDAVRHLEHWLALGGERTVALGSDFDGIEKTPTDLTGNRKLSLLAEELLRLGYREETVRAVFYKNAQDFFKIQNKRNTK